MMLPAVLCGYPASHHKVSISKSVKLFSTHTKEIGRDATPRRQATIYRTNAAAATSKGVSLLLETLEGRCKLDTQEVFRLAESIPLEAAMEAAVHLRDTGHEHVTFSPKVFIPLTRLCRNSCGYCTFAVGPTPGRRVYMTMEEILHVATLGGQQGCTEALFTLGDKPELEYPEAAAELSSMGFASTLEYLRHAAQQVVAETGLIPHINAGVMDRRDVDMLRGVSGSQGLMLETLSLRLMEPGGPHYMCPDKSPGSRVSTIEAAGQAAVPFTTGLLIGIGESIQERLEAMMEIRRLHLKYGHIQEVIIQNFRAKSGTAMHLHPEPPLEELLWTIAMARIILGPHMNIQAPPNLTPVNGNSHKDDDRDDVMATWVACLAAGINDWGGISPVTRDYVNPEKPWPHLEALAEATATAGKLLLPRLPIYPEYAIHHKKWLDGTGGAASVAAAVLRHMDTEGFSRASDWAAGKVGTVEAAQHSRHSVDGFPEASRSPDENQPTASSSASGGRSIQKEGSVEASRQLRSSIPMSDISKRKKWKVRIGMRGSLEDSSCPVPSQEVEQLLRSVLDGSYELSESDIETLFHVRGRDFDAVCTAADQLRQRTNGNTVTYVVNRNINYTNICTYKCQFCAFSKGKMSEELRGAPYLLPLDEISRRAGEAWERGATEVCMQGGIHPDFNGDTYVRILEAAKAGAPDIHVHAFSPLEVWSAAQSCGMTLTRYLTRLKEAGLGSLPGTAAEVLDDRVRSIICPDKITAQQWIEVLGSAHSVGLRSTSTIMFGHVDSYGSWASHLAAIRKLQRETGGITEFVPLPFVHMEAPIYRKGSARRGPTLRESVLMHAVSRLALHRHITNIQASWVKLGPNLAADLLLSGCNDMGGSIMNESITAAAGASHGQELIPERMEALIEGVGRVPHQRTTLYGVPPVSQTDRSFHAAPLSPLILK